MYAIVLMCVFTSLLTCSHLHVSSQGADPSLTSSTGQEDGDDGQQGADSQQSTASRTQHRTGLRKNTNTGQFHFISTDSPTSTLSTTSINPHFEQREQMWKAPVITSLSKIWDLLLNSKPIPKAKKSLLWYCVISQLIPH